MPCDKYKLGPQEVVFHCVTFHCMVQALVYKHLCDSIIQLSLKLIWLFLELSKNEVAGKSAGFVEFHNNIRKGLRNDT